MKHLILVFVLLSWNISADEIDRYRCGNHLLTKGMTYSDVAEACGHTKPVETFSWIDEHVTVGDCYRRGSYEIVKTIMEDWIFAPYGQFVTIVRFKDGEVSLIYQTKQRGG